MRAAIGDWLNQRALRVHRSRLGWREAPKYTRHWQRCQNEVPRRPSAWGRGIAYSLWRDGSASWTDYGATLECLTDVIQEVFRCDYTIYFAKSYKSEWTPERSGSQLWHADGGPGTCINVMRYDSTVTSKDGPLEVCLWPRSLELFKREPRGVSRARLCAFYASFIEPTDYISYTGPAGMCIAFMNNTIHRGGYPDQGHTRDVTVYHVYPSLRGSKVISDKTDAYPRDPDI